MGTTSEELKKLYKKLGGKDPKVAGFSAPGEILNAINEIPLPTEYELPTVTTEDAGDVLVVNDEGKWDKGEASGGLPEVTTDDNGDILQVVEGAWAKAAMSGSDIVVLQAITASNGISIQGATANQISTYLANGKVVVVIYGNLRLWFAGDVNYLYGIRRTNLAKIDLSYYEFYSSPANYIKIDGYALPRAYSDINGKILMVKYGDWSAEDPPSPTHAYSTTEQVVGTWIDGKPVYEKTIDCGAISANTWNQTATGVDNIDNVISIGGFVKSDTAVIPFTTNMTSSDATIHYVREQNKFQYWAIGSNATGVIIFRYTKTTD